MRIRDLVEVTAQPTVVRLEHLESPDPSWITSAYYVTEETGRHFKTLKALLTKETGCGIFLIGHYGSGKSHFLAYLTQQIRAGSFGARKPQVLPVSLLNYRASQSLEDILQEQLPVSPEASDRRRKWAQIEKQFPQGVLLILDELSEFLRSKPSAQSFNEDLRFLQFLGEWAQDHPLWILAALQEQIEHTGEIEYDLFRKIKDRYPIRLLLTPAHVKDLIAEKILCKKDPYRPAVEKLAADLSAIYPKKSVDYGLFCEIYPIHPATLEFLEEVRDRFSQSRGIVDFTLTQLLGNDARNIAPFLDQPWGHLLTPDAIIDHFSDLFEVQPEFLAIAQKVLPYFRKQVPVLYKSKNQQELAWQLLKLLILVHLSPRRNSLSVDEAALWLLYKVSTVDPDRNREIVKKTLDMLSQQAAFIKRQDSRYRLDLEDDSKEYLEQLLSKTIEELKTRGDYVFENLVPLLDKSEFNPFALPRDRWVERKIRWHFHDRDLQIYFGPGVPKEAPVGITLQIGIPWNAPAAGTGSYKILPKPIELDSEILELSALLDIKDRPLPGRVLNRIQERISARTPWFHSLIRNAYSACTFLDPRDAGMAAPTHAIQGTHTSWIGSYGEWILRQTYPQFEQFAPGHGPLPKEAYRQLMKFASEHDLGIEGAPEYVKLIREAYLVPMGLMQRRGPEYVTNQKLDNHELVRLLAPILDHHPTPDRAYQHLSAPVYGLVPDQIHLLLIMLLIQGEIDIVKGDSSYRDTYDSLVYPVQYDRILPGRALSLNQLKDLQDLCEGFRIPLPRQWSVLAQKRAIDQLRKLGAKYRDQLGSFAANLRTQGEADDLVERCEGVISHWLALEKGEHELQGFEHFLFATGSPRRFVSEVNELLSMPARFERLLRETRRYRHLFGYPAVSQCANQEIAARVERLGSPPPLAESEALEQWLRGAQLVYQDYRNWYQGRHETLWRDLNANRIWNYKIPGVARSRHFPGAGLIREIEDAVSAARAARCPGLGSLDFQPVCRCGFDGSSNPLQPALSRFEEAANSLEKELTLFFQQDSVKAKVKEWAQQGLELNDRTLAYVEGKSDYPETENLSLFDQHLAGIELVHTLEARPLLDLLSHRVWEKGALIKALEQHLARFGPRISFRMDAETPAREDLAAWCAEQSLTHACPLPKGLSASERSALPRLLQPKWVSEQSLVKLEELDLGESAVMKVIEMLLNGSVRPPAAKPESGIVAAALDLIDPKSPGGPEALMQAVTCLYEQADRLIKLRPKECLSRLEQLAETRLPSMPENLNALLQKNMDAQWIVVDCLGLPLVKTVQPVLSRCFQNWKFDRLEFAAVSEQTSTEAFYLGLIGGDLTKAFEKINGVDALIHNRRLRMKDFAKLAEAELEIAFRNIIGRLDRSRPILIYGDHGFRMTLDGTGFTHGGSSTLERITPVLRLIPA